MVTGRVELTSPNFSNGIGASVTTFAATAIVVADMVGIGVFTSLGFQVQTIDSGFSLILLWVIGGIVAFCGATCYAELAAMFPRSSAAFGLLAHPQRPFHFTWAMRFRTSVSAAVIGCAGS